MWFCVFLLLAVAVVAAQTESGPLPQDLAADRPDATTRGPLFHHVVSAARGLGQISMSAFGANAAD